MKVPFPWIWVAIVSGLLASPLFIDDPARAQFGVLAALIVATVPMKAVRGATVGEIGGVVLGAVVASLAAWQAVKGKDGYWIVAGLGNMLVFGAMRRRVHMTFGEGPGSAYLVALAMIVCAVVMYSPGAVERYGLRMARIASGIAVVALIVAAASRPRPGGESTPRARR